ncbi:hypothetical protein BS50DRAFT_49157 [Corynespora cassiicola Philippines]|uniref:Uncharacterized protein n=1 Tax=Corynespora cassiicola Philippines TaxID=1448308 RepID=A0A2T2NIX9_CORCC|nr:hypothetical protein BS50DRAFT_49157 [Corynespora cassiicola Philippines]
MRQKKSERSCPLGRGSAPSRKRVGRRGRSNLAHPVSCRMWLVAGVFFPLPLRWSPRFASACAPWLQRHQTLSPH